ncbi:MAG: hypothetical protein Q9190_001054 [Brigantiaea leucoxantha]
MLFYDIFEAFGALVGLISPLRDYDGSHQTPLQVSPSIDQIEQYDNGPVFSPPSASTEIQCQYPSMKDWKHGTRSLNRQSWLWNSVTGETFDIHTDYDQVWPEGVVRKVTDHWINADGYNKTDGKVVNGTYPGPWIEACWGDTLEITVANKLRWNGTTLHWHGLRQLHTMSMDGVNGVTQCPIAPGDHFTYRFKATQYGTSWYHSHYSLQYPDGLLGPMTIHGPSSANYDEPVKPFLMSDWNHKSAFFEWGAILRAPGPLNMESNVFNGIGTFVSDKQDANALKPPPKFEQVFTKGKRYLLRLINTSTDSTFIFSIDNHTIEVIGADFVPIVPYTTDSVLIGIGQRYHVIVEAKPTDGDSVASADQNYWIRNVLSQPGCGNITQPNERVGIIRYSSNGTNDPVSTRANYNLTCSDEPYRKLFPQTRQFRDSDIDTVFTYNNPPRRDVALLPANGYVALAFKTDNPGVWLLHCHIAWHVSSGLALQILERQKEILPSIGSLTETERVCKNWNQWYENKKNWYDYQFHPQNPEFQEDSGV